MQPPAAERGPATQGRDADIRQSQVAAFDQFLDSHPEVSEQLRANPSLVNNQEFLEKHPGLQQFLQEHPGIREGLKENANGFMQQEGRFERNEDRDRIGRDRDRDQDRDRDLNRDRDSQQVAAFDQFLDSHPEIAEQLRKNPSLVNNKEFVEDHPALQQFLRDNPGLGTEINENPKAFMHEEERLEQSPDRDNRNDDRDRNMAVDRNPRTATSDRDERATTADREQSTTGVDRDDVNGRTTVGARQGSATADTDRDRDVTKGELARTDQFFDSHPEIAEQLQKNPSLIDDKKFVKEHPALQDFLKTHPEIREEIKENPNAFMRQEGRFDQREDRDDMASFSAFLGAHASLAQELTKNPSLANNKEFQESHPELQEFLKAHPSVQAQLTSNPATVMSSVQATNATKPKATEPQH